ncbi:KAP115 [Symbiodinium microadriaticum]|nr:KAP115 [Symbiodinium microadriaticum]
MIKKGLVDLLLQSLDRTSSDLLVLAVTFLKKLSIFEENKNSFKQRGILVKLSKLLPCSSQPLMHATLRLLFNLSFDAEIRDQAVQIGMIPKLISLLKAPAFRARALRVLYHMSIEDRCKSMFTYTDGMPLIMGMIINFPQDTLPKELAGLSVNISLNARNAEVMASNRGLNHLMDRMMTTKDPLLMKIIRNISLWSFNSQQSLENADLQYKYRGLWSPHIKNICRLAVDADSHDLLVEVLGTLANLTILDLPMNQGWSKLLGDYNIMSLITKLLVPGMAQNDVLLEVIMIIAQAASDTHSCRMLAGNNIIGLLHQVWKDKGSDVEILLQLLFCFLKFFRQESCQEEAMYGTRVVVDIIDCLHHNSSAVRRIADQVCELVLELDREPTGDLGELGRKIRKKRFDSYNQKWLLEIAAEEESKLGLGSYGSYGEDELVRGHVHGGGSYDGGGYDDLDDYGHHITSGDQMYDEDIAWRAIRSANGGQLRLDADIDAIHEQMQMLGTNSSEGDTEDSWDGKQYK